MKDTLDYRAIGRRVLSLRKKKGLTQGQLAAQVDISMAFVGHIERGEKKASLETISRMAVALGSSMDYIVLGTSRNCNRGACPLYADLRELLDSYENM